MTINRRTAIAGSAFLAAFPASGRALEPAADLAATATPGVPVLAAASPLARLIETHRAALAEFEGLCPTGDDFHERYDPSPAARERLQWADDAETAALEALCTYRCQTLAEHTARADYFGELSGLGVEISHESLMQIMQSMQSDPRHALDGPTAASGSSAAELPIVRLERLAREMSAVLDEMNAEALAEDLGCETVAIWTARVWPAFHQHKLELEQRDVPAAYVRYWRQVRS